MSLAKILYGCHQIPERSFFIRGYQFPLCARCTGITVGYLLSVLLCVMHIIFPLWVSVIMLIPLLFDGGIQLLFCIMSNNIRRAVTGILYGLGFVQSIASVCLYLISL